MVLRENWLLAATAEANRPVLEPLAADAKPLLRFELPADMDGPRELDDVRLLLEGETAEDCCESVCCAHALRLWLSSPNTNLR